MNQIHRGVWKYWGPKNFNVKLLTFMDAANADADAGGSTIALRERCSGELKKN